LLAEHLGIAADNIMALGDQQNDLAMIKYAGLGVAMGNGVDEVKAASRYVTRSNREDGVAHAIEKFVLNA
ncbi:MAG: HAD hydrolase family protein, partial [Dyella sp.]